jgi:hypothetical protein
MVSDIGDLFPYRQLIVELIEKGPLAVDLWQS